MPQKRTDNSTNTILSFNPSAETVMTEIDKFSATKGFDEQIERNEDKEDECPPLRHRFSLSIEFIHTFFRRCFIKPITFYLSLTQI